MAYTHRLFDSIDAVDLTDWQQVRSAGADSIFSDPRFMAAVETGMRQLYRFWYIIVYDDGRPVACTSLAAITADLADFADPGLARIIRHVPPAFTKLRRLKLLICGLPVGTGHHTLALTQRATSREVLAVLDRVTADLAAELKMDAIVYKEFGQDDLEWTQPLVDLGYRRIPIPPMHCFKPVFADFAHYCAALKTRYRQQVNRSTRKLQRAGITPSVLSNPDEILRVYTPAVHGLYHQMAARANLKLETLPIELLQELTRRLKDQVELVLLSKDSRIVAFGWCLHAGSGYHMLYAGLDYDLNREFDLYFNLMYAGLDRAFRKRVSKVEVGISADAFKARIGCYSEPLYVFVKGLGPVLSLIVRAAGNLLVVQRPATAPSDIFRSDLAESSK